MVWTDRMIRSHPDLLEPFNPDRLDPCGYDLTLDYTFKLPILDGEQQVVDPFNPPEFKTVVVKEYLILPPGHFALGTSVEWINMPPDVLGICLGRSTYCRAGIVVHVSPLEPGWRGHLTIEISNTNPLPVKIWAGKGITQVVFLQADEMPEKDYTAKGGRYQDQRGVQQGRSDGYAEIQRTKTWNSI